MWLQCVLVRGRREKGRAEKTTRRVYHQVRVRRETGRKDSLIWCETPENSPLRTLWSLDSTESVLHLLSTGSASPKRAELVPKLPGIEAGIHHPEMCSLNRTLSLSVFPREPAAGLDAAVDYVKVGAQKHLWISIWWDLQLHQLSFK